MRPKVPLLLTVPVIGSLAAALPALAQKVRIDYDPSCDASKIKAFA